MPATGEMYSTSPARSFFVSRMALARKHGGWSWLAITGLIAVVGLTFWRVLEGEFIGLDDGNNIFLNQQLGGLNWSRLTWAFGDFGSARRYMPLGWLGFSAVFSWQGLAPLGYHAASLGWHLLGTVALFLGVRNILRLDGESTDGRWVAWVAALVAAGWALHPMRTEAVSWASGLLYTQGSAFAFIALWIWTLRWDRVDKSGWLAMASCLALAASLLTYPIALGLPVVCWLLDFLAGKSRPAFKPRAVPSGGTIALALMSGLALAVTLMARGKNTENFAATASLGDFGLTERVLQALYVWGRYIRQLFWPANLSPVYTDLYTLDPLSRSVQLTVLFSVVLLVAAGWLAWRRRMAPGLVLAYSAMALPFLGLLEHPWIAHDRYAMLLHPVWLVVGGQWLYRTQRRTVRLAASLVMVGVVAFWAVEARRLVGVWKDQWTLDARLQQTLPRDPWAGYYLGTIPVSVLFLDGRFDEIEPRLDRAEAAAPGWSAAEIRTEYRGLIAQHRAFLEQNWPGRTLAPLAVLHFLHGKAAADRRDWVTAQAHFQAALRVAGDFKEAGMEMGRCAWEMKRLRSSP
jgi:hypothetical protein